MERLAYWSWNRFRGRFGLVLVAIAVAVATVLVALPSALAVAWLLELRATESLWFAGVAVVVVTIVTFPAGLLIGRPVLRPIQRWARGDRSDPAAVLEASHLFRRVPFPVGLILSGPLIAALATVLGVVAGVRPLGLVTLGLAAFVATMIGVTLVAVGFDIMLRPVREEVDRFMADDGDARAAGDWRITTRLAAVNLGMCWASAMLATGLAVRFSTPEMRYAVATVASLLFAVAFCVVAWLFGLLPVLRPVKDLLAGTHRVARGEFGQRLPVTTEDELGDLVRSFNRMQRGLLERERLSSAFGSYVDPALAARLLAQGDDLFEGERVDVTVFFADVRNFTAYAEAHTPEQSVARLNELFRVVVPILHQHGGHANKYLGDGVLAVFGVPAVIADHADRAVAAAAEIVCAVEDAFEHELQIGIGVNTGTVIAGTIGGGGKLEFTLIGDAVNAAARIEQLTKTTGDTILIAETTRHALHAVPAGLASRGPHQLRGRSQTTHLFALDPLR